MSQYTKNDILLNQGDTITVQLLNESLAKLYYNINNSEYTPTSSTYATSALSGSVVFTDVITTSADIKISKAINPYSLTNGIKVFNSYINNDISATITDQEVSMKYLIVCNKTILMFGKINTAFSSSTIDLKKLFSYTPYTLSKLFFINIGGGEQPHTKSPLTILTSMSNEVVNIASCLSYTDSVSESLPIRSIDWFAIGKVL